jgi:UDP-N-acetylmuramyl tripeptide synthase
MNAVGDRRDEDIHEMGEVLGGAADQVFLYEDPHYRRGRAPGEITTILTQGLAGSGLSTDQIHPHDSEEQALVGALAMARSGDIVLVMTAQGDVALSVLRAKGGRGIATPSPSKSAKDIES